MILQDTHEATWRDLGGQYYLHEKDIGRNRAEVSVLALAELNDSVTVNCFTHALDEQMCSQFDVSK